MRPLPDLTDLAPQPAVFDQPTDDFATTFASEFTESDTLSTTASGEQTDVYAAVDPISQAIDGVGAMLNDAGAVFDLLSGDLDLVDLTPEITNFQAADSALDNNLSGVSFDLVDAAAQLTTFVWNIALYLANEVMQILQSFIGYIDSVIGSLYQAVDITGNPVQGAPY